MDSAQAGSTAAGSGRQMGAALPAQATQAAAPTRAAATPTPEDGWQRGGAAEMLTRTGVPLVGGVTAATARSPGLLLAVVGYSVLVDPASPVARALTRVLDPAAEALGEALSLRIRRWGRR